MKSSVINILIVFFSISVYSQKTILSDSEYQELHDKARILINSDIDSSFIYANKIEKSNNPLHKAFAYGIKSYLYQLKGDSIKSKNLYKQSFSFLDKVPQSVEKEKHKSYLLAYGGLAEWKRGHLKLALQLYEEGKKIAKKNDDIIQLIKFNNNIANLYKDAENYKLAIKIARNSDYLLDKNQFITSKEIYNSNKSSVNLNLAALYESVFKVDVKQKDLDSAKFYFNQTIIFSTDLIKYKIAAKSGLGNIYYYSGNYDKAIKTYLNLVIDLKENNQEIENPQIYHNLGIILYDKMNYDKALFYFTKHDSIYKINPINKSWFLESNYYQAKIYEKKNNPSEAFKHAKIYLDNFQLNEEKKKTEISKFNATLAEVKLEDEMIQVRDKFKNKVLLEKGLKLFALICIPLLILLLIVNIRRKKNTDKKIQNLLNEFEQLSNKNIVSNHIEEDNNFTSGEETSLNKKGGSIINLDEEKENEILLKLSKLIDKEEFLKEGFTLQYVANKIKTNTTYLSYVVNKKFEKTFSEFANELKINYAINEMINNPTYRKYSTQAIAESVGFKNAVSFTKSFQKRTGVTPAQFIKKID